MIHSSTLKVDRIVVTWL